MRLSTALHSGRKLVAILVTIVFTVTISRVDAMSTALSLCAGPCRGLRLLLGLVVALALPAQAQPPVAGKSDAKLDLSYIPADAAFAAILHPRALLTSPDIEWLPVEVLSAASLKEFGVDPAEIERAVILGFLPNAPLPRYGAIVRFRKTVELDKLLLPLKALAKPDKIEGRDVLRVDAPLLPSLCLADERTLLLAPLDDLKRMLAAKDVGSPLHKQLKKADVSHHLTTVLSYDALREIWKERGPAAEDLPPPLADLASLIDHVSAQELRLDLGLKLKTQAVLYARSDESVPEIERLVKSAVASGKEFVLALQDREFKVDTSDPVQVAMKNYARRLTIRVFDSIKTVRHEGEAAVTVTGIGEISMVGALSAVLLPAVQAAREAARRSVSANNLRQLALSCIMEDTAKNRLPLQASYDKDGKKLLSWRVHILPYLEREDLYERFRLDEPWDSEHNKKLIPLMPSVFQNPNLPAGEFKTNYLAVSGKGTLFDGQQKISLGAIRDGTANTLMLVEANADRAVIWTKPEDLEVDEKDPPAGLGKLRPSIFVVAFADGHVTSLPTSLPPKTLWAIFTRNGRETVELP
jgi:hypothetical protein